MIEVNANCSALNLSLLWRVLEELRVKRPNLVGYVIRAHPAQMAELKSLCVWAMSDLEKEKGKFDPPLTNKDLLAYLRWMFCGEAKFQYDDLMPKSVIFFEDAAVNGKIVGTIKDLIVPVWWT